MDTCVRIGLSECESTAKLGIKCWTWSIQLSELGRQSFMGGDELIYNRDCLRLLQTWTWLRSMRENK